MIPSTRLVLPIWAGYRAGPSDDASTGELEVRFHGDRITPRQRAAVVATRARAASMKALLLDAIVTAYPTFRAWHARPSSITKSELKQRVCLWGLIVTKDHYEDVAYVAYMFSCVWDPSGFVVLTHGDRVVAAGGYEVLEYPHRDPMRAAPKPKRVTPAQRLAARTAAAKRAKKNSATLRLDDDREMQIYLPVWAGFVSQPLSKLSSGEVRVRVGGDTSPVAPEQAAAYRRVLTRAAAAQRIVLDAIAAAFPKLARDADLELALPKRVDRAELANLVELVGVHLHDVYLDGVAYIGYQLACAWEVEHGLGVLTHLDRVVEVGHADTAFLSWVAERDQRKKNHRRTRRPAR